MRPENSGPFRKVVDADSGMVSFARRRAWHLECGHIVYHKRSVPIARLAHCRECLEKVPGPGAQRKCRVCGCTDADCSGCIERTGEPCHWIEADLCSACEGKG